MCLPRSNRRGHASHGILWRSAACTNGFRREWGLCCTQWHPMPPHRVASLGRLMMLHAFVGRGSLVECRSRSNIEGPARTWSQPHYMGWFVLKKKSDGCSGPRLGETRQPDDQSVHHRGGCAVRGSTNTRDCPGGRVSAHESLLPPSADEMGGGSGSGSQTSRRTAFQTVHPRHHSEGCSAWAYPTVGVAGLPQYKV